MPLLHTCRRPPAARRNGRPAVAARRPRLLSAVLWLSSRSSRGPAGLWAPEAAPRGPPPMGLRAAVPSENGVLQKQVSRSMLRDARAFTQWGCVDRSRGRVARGRRRWRWRDAGRCLCPAKLDSKHAIQPAVLILDIWKATQLPWKATAAGPAAAATCAAPSSAVLRKGWRLRKGLEQQNKMGSSKRDAQDSYTTKLGGGEGWRNVHPAALCSGRWSSEMWAALACCPPALQQSAAARRRLCLARSAASSKLLLMSGRAQRPAAHCTPRPRPAGAAPCPGRTARGGRTQIRRTPLHNNIKEGAGQGG